jgi:hypothetical protein
MNVIPTGMNVAQSASERSRCAAGDRAAIKAGAETIHRQKAQAFECASREERHRAQRQGSERGTRCLYEQADHGEALSADPIGG